MVVKDWIDRMMNKSAVAHALAANDRYNSRLGPQFAAGITYFSVLSMVPILMFSFAALGMTLTVIRPELMDVVLDYIEKGLTDAKMSKDIKDAVVGLFQGWASVGVVALLTAAYSGSNWVGNLKRAIRVMWSKEFEDAAEKKNFFVELGLNLLTFVGLLVCIVFSVGVATVGSTFSRNVLDWLGWSEVPGIGFLFALLAIGLSFVASWILMAFLFIVMPNQPARPRPWLVGTLIGAVALTVIQQLAGRLVGLLSGNKAAGIFGSAIVLMLLFNIIATIILMAAAWVGSSDEWREERAKRIAEKQERLEAEARKAAGEVEPPVVVVEPEPESVVPGRWAATKSLDDLRGADQTLPEPEGEFVRQKVAARGMRINLGLGYGVGAATGLGVGALIVAVAKKIFSRR